MGSRSRLGRSMACGLAALLGLSGAALAHENGGGGCERGRPLMHLEERLDNLGLEPQTLEAARGLLDQGREARHASHDEMRGARDQMRELLNQEKPDVDAILAQVDTIAALETQAKKARLRTILAVRALLTPEQWTQLMEPPAGGKRHHGKGIFF
jgi:Spy/CpxP family protein refolding chaperone